MFVQCSVGGLGCLWHLGGDSDSDTAQEALGHQSCFIM